MDTKETIFARRSVRHFTDEPVSRADMEEILAAAIAAPSSKNRQPWRFFVAEGSSKHDILVDIAIGLKREQQGNACFLPGSHDLLGGAFRSLEIMQEAPVIVFVTNTLGVKDDFSAPTDTDERVGEICNVLSIGAAIENMILAAWEKGIASVWLGDIFFAYPELRRYFMAKEGKSAMPVAAVCFGHAAEENAARPRNKLSETAVFWEKE